VEVQGFEPWSGSAMVTLSTRLEEHYIQIWQAVLLTNQTYIPLCTVYVPVAYTLQTLSDDGSDGNAIR